MTAGHANEGADDHADHFVEEAIAFEGERDQFAVLVEVSAVDGAHFIGGGVLFSAAIGAEGGEVVGADEDAGSFVEQRGAEAAVEVPGEAVFQRREDFAVPEAVVVDFSGGVEAGVEIGGDLFAAHDANGWWQYGIQGAVPFGFAQPGGGWGVEVGHLGEGMDAGVGTA